MPEWIASCRKLSGLTALSCCAASLNAQPIFQGEATRWQWQASLDDGQTWSSGRVDVSNSSSAIRVRGLVTFPTTFDRTYFGGVLLDPYVEGLAQAGLADTISNISRGEVPYTIQQLHTVRIGNRVKIDDISDRQAPGLGPDWAQSSQGPNNGTSPTPLFNNPISAFDYTLNLDGTVGDRLVTAAWSTDTAFGFSPYLVTYVRTFQAQGHQWRHPLTEEQLTIRVVPTPASVSLLAVSGMFAARRRRGRS